MITTKIVLVIFLLVMIIGNINKSNQINELSSDLELMKNKNDILIDEKMQLEDDITGLEYDITSLEDENKILQKKVDNNEASIKLINENSSLKIANGTLTTENGR